MSKTNETWLALRRPDGSLEPLTKMRSEDLVRLAYQAGLIGIPLQDWLVEILRAAVDEQPPEHETAESFLGPRFIELKIPPDLLDQMTRQSWDAFDEAMHLGGQIDSWLYFVSGPGGVLLAARLARKGTPPAEVARQVARQQVEKMSYPVEIEDVIEKAEQRMFERMKQEGQLREPLEVARASVAAGTLAAS